MKLDLIIIEAIVEFNKGEAFVLSRNPVFLYTKKGKRLYAIDGPFINTYEYGWMGTKGAFADRHFDIPMLDGSIIKATGQYWDAGISAIAKELNLKLIHVTFQTKENLRNCYVFTGAYIDLNWIKNERSKYKGCIYPYEDYEKIINFDNMKSQAFQQIRKLEKAKKNLIIKVKEKHSLIIELKRKESEQIIKFMEGEK